MALIGIETSRAAPAEFAGSHDVGVSLEDDGSVAAYLARHQIPRRTFLGYCGALAAILAVPRVPYARQIAQALSAPTRLPVVWLNGQDCNGNIESFLRAPDPTIGQLIMEKLSINYVELLMAPSGATAEQLREDTIKAGGYVCVVEGAIPTAGGGVYACVGGRAHVDIVKETVSKATATIAVGTCAYEGGLAAARGGVTGAVGVRELMGPGPTIVALPGCPMNVDNLVATIVHYLTFGSWPATDRLDRPLFAYGNVIHDQCPRREHFDEGRFVRAWGDKGHQLGWCLRYMGCQGPETRGNCPKVKWNGGTSWPVNAGMLCIGCTTADFWDVRGGFYKHRKGDD